MPSHRHFVDAGFATTLYGTGSFVPNNATNALLGSFHLLIAAVSRLATSGNGHAFQTHV